MFPLQLEKKECIPTYLYCTTRYHDILGATRSLGLDLSMRMYKSSASGKGHALQAGLAQTPNTQDLVLLALRTTALRNFGTRHLKVGVCLRV